MNKKILIASIFATLMLLIIPFTVSASSKINNDEEGIGNNNYRYVFAYMNGKIKNLGEIIIEGEGYYTSTAISVKVILISYEPPLRIDPYFAILEECPLDFPKEGFYGYISEFYVFGFMFGRYEI